MVETVRTSCMRRPSGPGTRAQQTTSALPTSSAATRSMISGSSISTCIALASLVDPCGGGHPQELQGTGNLIHVLEAHATAHSTAPGARLWDGLERPSEHDVNGWPRSIFTPHRRSPAGEIQDYGSGPGPRNKLATTGIAACTGEGRTSSTTARPLPAPLARGALPD